MSAEIPHPQEAILRGEELKDAAQNLYDRFDQITSTVPPFNNYELFLKFIKIYNTEAMHLMQYPPVMSFKDDEGRSYELKKDRESYKKDDNGNDVGAEKYMEKRWFFTIANPKTKDGQHEIIEEAIVNLELVNNEPIFHYVTDDLRGGWNKKRTRDVNNKTAVIGINGMLTLLQEKVAANTLRAVHTP